MKQNKKYSAIIIAIIVLASNLAITGFAYTDNSINNVDFNNQPIVKNHTGNEFLDGTHLFNTYVTSDHSQETYYYAYTEQDKEYYAFLAGSSSYTLYVVGQVSGIAYLSISSNNVVAQNVTLDCRQIIDNNTGLYGRSYSIGSPISAYTYESDIPIFNSDSDGYAAVLDWIENPPSDTNPHSLTLSVPAGNALYIDVRNNTNLSITMTMQSDVAHPYNWSSNQYFGYATEYPSSFDGNPSGSNVIEWHGYGDKTILNRYKTFSWSLIPGGPSHQYFFICNPYATVDEYDQSFNPTIIVTVNSANGYKYYQMTGGISESGAIGQHTDGVTGSGVYDDESETWDTVNDSTGLPWEPQEGGGNIITNRSINDWLQQISSQIGNFFSGAIGAVTNLVSAGSAFFQTLIGLYGWLPISVMSVLSSALIIVITIGVIKVFL